MNMFVSQSFSTPAELGQVILKNFENWKETAQRIRILEWELSYEILDARTCIDPFNVDENVADGTVFYTHKETGEVIVTPSGFPEVIQRKIKFLEATRCRAVKLEVIPIIEERASSSFSYTWIKF